MENQKEYQSVITPSTVQLKLSNLGLIALKSKAQIDNVELSQNFLYIRVIYYS